MAWTSADLTALEDAIAQGVTTLSIAGKTVTYRSQAEMLRLRDIMRTELGLTDAQRRARVLLVRPRRQ